MGKLKSKVGTAILGAAVIDDILGIVVLTILTALTDPSVKPILVLGRIVAFFGFVLVVGLVMYRVFLKMEEKVASSSPYRDLCGCIRIPDELRCGALLRYCRYYRCILRRHRNVPSVLCA
mgnify:CR=1 FL=1